MNTIVLHNRIQDIINSYLVLAGVYTMMGVEQTQGYRISFKLTKPNSVSLCVHNYLVILQSMTTTLNVNFPCPLRLSVHMNVTSKANSQSHALIHRDNSI